MPGASPQVTTDDQTVTTSFEDLGVSREVVAELVERGITSPFPIQRMTIPDAMAGRDVLGKAKTGSGKTLAFGLPIVERITPAEPRHPRALVLVPTRELAVQVNDELSPLLAARGASTVTVYGGSPMKRQIRALDAGVELVVATPGRLIDLIQREAASMDAVEVAILDEADEMADMGFLLQVNQIMRRVPGKAQVMLFSATLDYRVQSLVDKYMTDPVSHEVESETVTVDESEHRFLEVHHMDKPKVVARLAQHHERVMVFVRTKRNCDRVADDLRELGVQARAIHGDIHQSKRQKALSGFADGKTEVLVATNVAARGLHVDGVGVVIHYDPPDDARTYVHRSGRTARAGEEGLVVTFVEWDQKDAVRRIQREAGLSQPIVKMFSNDDRLDDLAGWQPPIDDEPSVPPAPRSTNRPRRRRRI